MEILVAYLHYASILLTAGCLTAELAVCRPGLSREQVRLLPRLDLLYFAGALAALATGLVRLFFYAKGVAYYLPNHAFHAKLALYVAIAVVSVWPTLRFGRWSRAVAAGGSLPSDPEVARTRRLLHVELGLLALMPLMAVLMARGVGRP